MIKLGWGADRVFHACFCSSSRSNASFGGHGMFGRKSRGGDTTQGSDVAGSTRSDVAGSARSDIAGSTRQDQAATASVAFGFDRSPMPGNPIQHDLAQGSSRLIIGQGLTFSGAIDACNHLIVSGSVVSDVKLCDRLEIAADGSFEGSATVNDADIAGLFEGELVVLGHLRLRETGRIRGRVIYGTLSVETGGRLLGITDSSAEVARPQPRPVVVPLRPVAHTAARDSHL